MFGNIRKIDITLQEVDFKKIFAIFRIEIFRIYY
jgi:hypothetical protein